MDPITPINHVMMDLHLVEDKVFRPNGYELSHLTQEKESRDYCALRFQLNEKKCLYRVAKRTPSKAGYFVTVWKRNEKGPIEPFSIEDPIDVYFVCIKDQEKFGHFIFPRKILLEKHILSSKDREGKRAFRVYPPWVNLKSRQALKSQKWQGEYFVDFSSALDVGSVQKILM